MISTGGTTLHLAVDIILTVSELDELIKWYGQGNTEYDEKLYNNLKTIRDAVRIRGVKRIGSVDDTRLNWK